MLEYVNQPEETANTLRKHADGLTWVHTGDLGMMDSDGFVYFRQRIKRIDVYKRQLFNSCAEPSPNSALCRSET